MLDFAGMLASGRWKELETVASERGLERLSQGAQCLVLESHAPSTIKKYTGAFRRWSEWAQRHGFSCLPASSIAVTLYLVDLLEGCKTVSPITSAVTAIQWAHRKACERSPVDAMVDQVVVAAKRRLARSKQRMEPLARHEVATAVEKLTESGDCLQLRTAVFIAVGFAGFLRWDDLECINVGDLSFHEDHMEIRLHKRKNDQFREGSVVLVCRQEGSTCPVELCELLIASAGLLPEDRLLSNLVRTKAGWRKRQGALKYARAMELLRQTLQLIGLCPKKYVFHSLRSGGVTTAAAAKVPERLLKRHGGWKSEAIHAYVQESLDNLLAPSRAASWN